MNTQAEVRKSFWDAHPEFKQEYRATMRQNQYRTDIRCAFVDFVDGLHRDGELAEKLAERVTL